MKVVKAAAQVLNTLWQYRDLRNVYKRVKCPFHRDGSFFLPQTASSLSSIMFACVLCLIRTGGTKTISSLLCRLWSETGTDHNPRFLPATYRCHLSSNQVSQQLKNDL